MKTHYKLKDGKWHVYQDRSEKLPHLIVPGSLRDAAVEWEKWLHVNEILKIPYTMEVRH